MDAAGPDEGENEEAPILRPGASTALVPWRSWNWAAHAAAPLARGRARGARRVVSDQRGRSVLPLLRVEGEKLESSGPLR